MSPLKVVSANKIKLMGSLNGDLSSWAGRSWFCEWIVKNPGHLNCCEATRSTNPNKVLQPFRRQDLVWCSGYTSSSWRGGDSPLIIRLNSSSTQVILTNIIVKMSNYRSYYSYFTIYSYFRILGVMLKQMRKYCLHCYFLLTCTHACENKFVLHCEPKLAVVLVTFSENQSSFTHFFNRKHKCHLFI